MKITLDKDNKFHMEFTRLEKIDMWLFDHIFLYRWLFHICHFLEPRHLKGVIKRFYQRLTRGWDDSDTWNLDLTFMKWLSPRLKRYAEICDCYCDPYNSKEEYTKDILDHAEILDHLIEYNFEEYDYKYCNAKTDEGRTKAYYKDQDKFMKWFSTNLKHFFW